MKTKSSEQKPSWRQRLQRVSTPSWRRDKSVKSKPRWQFTLPGLGWLAPLRPILPFAVAIILIGFISGVLYVRFWMLEEQPLNASLPMADCSVYPGKKKLEGPEAYGYLLLINERKIEKMVVIHIGQTIDQQSYVRIINLPVQQWLSILDSTRFQYVTISNLLAAGDVDQADNPLCFVVKNVSSQIGAPADFVIAEEKKDNRYRTQETLLTDRSSVGTLESFWQILQWGGVSANISHINIVDLKKEMWLADSQRREYTVSTDASHEVITSSGDKLRVLDFKQFTDQNPEALASAVIGSEQALVEIYNGTEGKGLASIYSRFMRTVGIDVIRIGNVPVGQYPDDLDIYITNDKQYPYTLATINKVFSNRPVRYFYNQRPTNVVTTGDIIVVIRK